MKLMIAGSRSIKEFDLKQYVPKEADVIITGGANGVDTIAEKFADDNKISKLVIRPDYSRYKRAAPLKRNEVMIDLSDKVLIIWDGKSKGSEYAIKYAQKRGKQLQIVNLAEK